MDEAHARGLLVPFELVHAHASANIREGLPEGYFLSGAAGRHPVWGTRLFDFGKKEALRCKCSPLQVLSAASDSRARSLPLGSLEWIRYLRATLSQVTASRNGGDPKVIRFLLANLCWFAHAFNVDGFRLDAVGAAAFSPTPAPALSPANTRNGAAASSHLAPRCNL